MGKPWVVFFDMLIHSVEHHLYLWLVTAGKHILPLTLHAGRYVTCLTIYNTLTAVFLDLGANDFFDNCKVLFNVFSCVLTVSLILCS
jgi:hypothetical protein